MNTTPSLSYYIEFEFFGRQSGHAGLVWKNLKRAYEGKFDVDAINTILKRIGINKVKNKNEFDNLGFGGSRQTED